MLPKAPRQDRDEMYRSFMAMYSGIARANYEAFSTSFDPFRERIYSEPALHWGVSISAHPRKHPEIQQAIGPWLDCGFGVFNSGEGSFGTDFDPATGDEFVRLPVSRNEGMDRV